MTAMDPIRKTPSETEIVKTLSQLKLSTTVPQKPLHKPKSKPVADSWDLESSGSDTETESASVPVPQPSHVDEPPQPPPPTPASPTPFDYPDSHNARLRGDSGAGSGVDRLEKRPEKTTAVAGRMIAGALGVRAPRRTEEEREYDRVVREKERKRRAEEKERERREGEEREARKKAVWDD